MEFIGIDVHKRDSQAYILGEEGEVVLEQRLRTQRERVDSSGSWTRMRSGTFTWDDGWLSTSWRLFEKRCSNRSTLRVQDHYRMHVLPRWTCVASTACSPCASTCGTSSSRKL